MKLNEALKSALLTHEAFDIIENIIGEDYPTSFNMEEFKTLTSFKDRIAYCNQHLRKIASGSSRVVFMIDNEKVLKLAKNKKGLAQNEVEYDYSQHLNSDPVLAKVFDADTDNHMWIEMELARKLTQSKFKQLRHYDWEHFAKEVMNVHYENNGRRQPNRIPEDIKMFMWEDEVFAYQIFNLMVMYPEFKGGDLAKLNSYGLVKRNGEDTVALIDFGLTNNVWDSYYS